MKSILRAAAACALVIAAGGEAGAASEIAIAPRAWRVIARHSGPVNYYSVVTDPAGDYVHARYEPPWATTVLGYPIPDGDRRTIKKLRWTWRAVTLPHGGDECNASTADSAAVVYVT